MFDISFLLKTFVILWKGVPTTLLITIVSLLIGSFFGFLIALTRIHKTKVLNELSAVYVSFMRGTPVVLQILVVVFLLYLNILLVSFFVLLLTFLFYYLLLIFFFLFLY